MSATRPVTRTGAGWYAVENEAEIASPALLLYKDRLLANTRRVIEIAGGTRRLRPHVKTSKCPRVVGLLREHGIERFKCATVAEAEMLAVAGATDVLLAMQLTGPHPMRLAKLAAAYPGTRFGTIVDDASVVEGLDDAAGQTAVRLDVYLDLDSGMHRSGIEPGPEAAAVYERLCAAAQLAARGLHVYDGHLRDPDLDARRRAVEAAMRPVLAFRDELRRRGLAVEELIAGGSGSFPIHAEHADRQCSPGTCFFGDARTNVEFPDLDCHPAAVLLTRVISRPGSRRVCLDLGHKAVAAERPPDSRVSILGLERFEVTNHSEEHLTIETDEAERFAVGDAVYAVPHHICPTCNLHQEAVVIDGNRAVDRWPITARDRRLGV